MNFIKKSLSVIISITVIIVSMIPITANAASENMLRNSVVSIAENEVGYTGTSSYSKYGEWYGYQGSWCTTFVFWCFNKAGQENSAKLFGSIIPGGGNCNSMISWFSNKGRYNKRTSGYTPKPGDLVFFDWSGNGSSQHVGIVTGTSGSTVYTVEGNCSGKVKSRTYTSSGSKPYNNISAIMGYGVPAYSSAGGKDTDSGKTTSKKTASANTEKKDTKQTQKEKTSKHGHAASKPNNSTSSVKEKSTQNEVTPESLTIHASSYNLQIGDTVKLNYDIKPSDAVAVVGYFCDEEGIIEIGSEGSIKAVGTGTATVVVCANNELYKQCDFKVSEAVAKVTQHKSQERKIVGTTEMNITETEKNVQNVLTEMGVNVNALSQNKQLYIIPLTIIAATFLISVFVAIVKKIKKADYNENRPSNKE